MMSTHHYVRPQRFDVLVNRIVGRLTRHGVHLAGAELLTVRGRRSGAPQTIPVNPLRSSGGEYLVAVRGETQWVRNARAAGTAELRRGRRARTVTLTEVDVTRRPEIIAGYLARRGWEVGRFLPDGLTAGASAEQIAPFAHLLPVFAVRAS
ncbi:MAG: nitroreductase/quinone reductase family protein [Gordonia sp. (in: high G+C Gram-positive bacteria)]